ncbi:FAD:protein FMN transferase [Murimonas intestini]|uniref:FAD:protein FMN transferase n=1 Tax=Murimonas intestini TaxID=1337051 RepID=A0AB73T9B3_9FIRM|nr:FAD:protein FMN transferase [Murimonas intestini]MCR1839339.1 FAD:protein FMN transferase [Murimonas intestini]MCR1864634.1 FAD:protein FMN transferase [Murimonas intestini]MCR1882244.1 FAD:protein FMN transferase [Murimonas intestini]
MKYKNHKYRNHGCHLSTSLICILLFLLICGTAVSCARPSSPISRTGFYFDTVITITLYDEGQESVLDDCFSLCGQEEALLSRTVKGSDIYNINSSKGRPVTVSLDTARLLEKALDYSRLSDGAFDCTIAPLTTLWNIKENTGDIPSEEKIEDALSHVSYKNIVIDKNTVTLKDPEASIDLGGIAKGYIADRLKELLLSKGVKNALINLGGNVYALGTKPDGSPYNIGIQKPFAQEGTALTSVKISGQSLVTSGIYERYFEKDGRIYHHLLDPHTGWPASNGLYSVTILSENSVDADALSTACFILGEEKGMELIESLEGTEAMFVTDKEELHYSSGFPR